MKRASELRILSSDHHRALVFARRAKRAKFKSSLVISDLWKEIESYYSTELEIHLKIEEAHIGYPLEAMGKTDLVEKLYKDHKEIRCFFEAGSSRSAADLEKFGKLLEQHVRFEERELFNVVQECLSPEALNCVQEACGG